MIRWTLVASIALMLSSCSDDLIKNQDKRVAETKPDPTAFSLTNSQTCGVTPPAALPEDETAIVDGVTMSDLSASLGAEGIDGWIHAAAAPFGEYVFTYRKGSFFNHLEMAMIPADAEVAKSFAGLARNDKVHIVGTFINKLSPLGHILVSSLTVVKKYEPVTPSAPYEHSENLTDLATELKAKTALYAVVHAQTTGGGVLVVDYKDMVLPVFVSEQHREAAKSLFRGDVVGIAYDIREMPKEPLHIETNPKVKDAIVTYDHMVWCNGKETTMSGELVLFEKSPQISMNVYALRHTDSNGMSRNWTLVNFEDMDAFMAIQAKIEAAWNEHKDTAVNGRNQLINRKLKVTATGMMNVLSPSQANPQIMLSGPDAVTIEVVE